MNIYTSRTYSYVIKNYTNYTKGRVIMIGFSSTTKTIVLGMYRDITAKSWNISFQYKNKKTHIYIYNDKQAIEGITFIRLVSLANRDRYNMRTCTLKNM